MRIAILGGSAFSTPSLLHFLGTTERREPLEMVLAGRSTESLEAVKRASLLLAGGNVSIRCERMADNNWHRVLDGADCVLLQIRVGGYEGRVFDETFPHKYGLCGDEGLGVGGLSAGWRTWPILRGMLDAIANFCPRALVILLTSPLSLLVRAAYRHTDVNLVGICELPWATLQALSGRLRKPPADVQADYLGVNHLGWFFDIRSGSGSLLDEIADATPEGSFASGDFLRTHRCLPTRYLRLHYDRDALLAEQVAQAVPRSATLSGLQKAAYRTYREESAPAVAATLDARPTPWYAQAVGPLLTALSGGPAGEANVVPFFLSVRNSSHTSLLSDDDVVECRHEWLDGKAVRVPPAANPPEHVAQNLLQFVHYERAATEAMMKRSGSLLIESLSLHPWTRGHADLKSIANEIITYNENKWEDVPRG